MRKWVAIRVSAALAVAGSVATLLFSAAMAAAVLLTPAREVGPLAPEVMKIAGVAVAALFAGGAVWGLCSGFGVLRRRNWARVSMTLFAGLLAFSGVVGALTTIVMPFGAAPDIDQRMAAIVRIGMIACYALAAALGSWWLVLFTRRPALEYFAAAPDAPNPRPISVSIIAWSLIVSAVITALAAALRAPAEVFGAVPGGWVTAVVYTIATAAQIYLGAGLLQLDKAARAWTIAYFCVAAANGAVIVFTPAFRDGVQELALQIEGYSRMDIPDVGNGWWLALACAVAAAVPIWLLALQRAAFKR